MKKIIYLEIVVFILPVLFLAVILQIASSIRVSETFSSSLDIGAVTFFVINIVALLSMLSLSVLLIGKAGKNNLKPLTIIILKFLSHSGALITITSLMLSLGSFLPENHNGIHSFTAGIIVLIPYMHYLCLE